MKARLCEVKYVYLGIVFTCSTLHLFSYPVPAGDQGSVQHLTLRGIPVAVFIKLLSFCSEVKELKCQSIHPPQKVQCLLMYSVVWDALVFRMWNMAYVNNVVYLSVNRAVLSHSSTLPWLRM